MNSASPFKRHLVLRVGTAFLLMATLLCGSLAYQQQIVGQTMVTKEYARVVGVLSDTLGNFLSLGNWTLANMLLMHQIGKDHDVLYALVADRDGIVQISLDEGLIGRPLADAVPVRDASHLEARAVPLAFPQPSSAVVSISSGFSATHNAAVYDFSIPIAWRSERVGTLRVGVRQAVLDGIILENVRWLVVGLVFGLMMIMVVAFNVASDVGRPLIDLTKKLKSETWRRSHSDLSDPTVSIDLSGFLESKVAEVRDLAKAFDLLQAELTASMARHIEFEKQRQEIANLRVIAQTTQMLAHDVRKPFSTLNAVFSLLKSAPSQEEMLTLISRAEPHIARSVVQVEAMLEDILESGKSAVVEFKPILLHQLIAECYADQISQFASPDVLAVGIFTHCRQPVGDAHRVVRVLSNIISNALQAMKGHGVFKVTTRDVVVGDTAMVEISLHNDGPHIPGDSLAKIFEPYFTSGKKKGTGLGMTIARKVVVEHGGTIACRSTEGEGVTFTFTIPAGADDPSSAIGECPLNAIELPTRSSSKQLCGEQA